MPTRASSISSSSVMQGEAECGDGGMILGDGAGLFTIWTLKDGLGGNVGGGGGGVSLLIGAACVIARSDIDVRLRFLLTSLGLEKSNNISAAS